MLLEALRGWGALDKTMAIRRYRLRISRLEQAARRRRGGQADAERSAVLSDVLKSGMWRRWRISSSTTIRRRCSNPPRHDMTARLSPNGSAT